MTSFKRSMHTLTLSAPNPATGHLNPRLPRKLLGTHRQLKISLLWGHCLFLLGPGAHEVLCVPSQSLFPQSCVSSGSSMVGLMTTSKRADAIPRSIAPGAPAPVAGHPDLQETLTCSSGLVSAGFLCPGADKVCLRPPGVFGEDMSL